MSVYPTDMQIQMIETWAQSKIYMQIQMTNMSVYHQPY